MNMLRDYLRAEADGKVEEFICKHQVKAEVEVNLKYDFNAKFTISLSNTMFYQGNISGLNPTGTWWLDVYSPSVKDLNALAIVFGIHPLTVEDILSEDEVREKCEVYEKYTFLCIKTQDNDGCDAFLYLLMYSDFVLSLRMQKLRHTYNVLFRLSKAPHVPFTNDWIVYAILDDVIDTLAPVIKRMNFDVECLEDIVKVLDAQGQDELLLRMRVTSKRVTEMIQVLQLKDEVVKSFINKASNYLQKETQLYLRDIIDHLFTLQESMKILKESVQSLFYTYVSKIVLGQARVLNDTNKKMNTLSVVGIMFVPLSFVTGLFGMNVQVPFQDDKNLQAFWGLLSGCMFVLVGAYYYGKKVFQ